jgi:hypothetical protein
MKPADAGGADDLLSKLAGDEIDRLLAESDGGEPESAPVANPHSVPKEPVAPVPPPQLVAAPTVAEVNLDDVLNTADADRAALHESVAPISGDPSLIDRAVIDLGETAGKHHVLSILLKPLIWLNAPLDPWPDQFRDILGKIGVMTLVNALAVIAYVLLFRRHHQ